MAGDRVRRLAWTLAAVGVVWLGAQIVLPGVNRNEFVHIFAYGGSRSISTGELQVLLSVFALGMGPLVNAFLLVELAALVVPSWRPLRHGGPTGRRALGRATAYLAVVLAAVQAYFIASYLQALSDGGVELFAGGLKSRLLVVLTLIGGTMILVWLIAGICQRGLGNGFAVLLLLGCVSSVRWQEIPPTANAFVAIGAAVLVIGIAAMLLDARPGRIPWPASGLLPLSYLNALAALFSALSALGVREIWLPELPIDGGGVAMLAVVGFTLLWAYVFARPSLSGASRSEWWTAALVSMLALTAVLVTTSRAREVVTDAESLLDPWKLVLATAIALDLFDELVARRRVLVPVWPLHAPLRIHEVRERLTAAGIEHHLQSRRLRTLLWFFGPHVPIMVLVPPDDAANAERLLRESFTAAST
jgi:hypothetical protein